VGTGIVKVDYVISLLMKRAEEKAAKVVAAVEKSDE
jgi:hypothetical protein